MTITVSSRQAYSISRDNGSTWVDFPKLPNKRTNTPMSQFLQRIDGTEQIGQFWNIELGYDMLTQAWASTIMGMYSPTNQNILLNYLSDVYSSGLPVWVYAPAVWAEPPTGDRVAMLWKNAAIRFTLVEYYLPT